MEDMNESEFAAEHLRLERAAVELERETLAAERERFEREMDLKRNRPDRSLTGFLTSVLLIMVAFAVGYVLGGAEERRQLRRNYEQAMEDAYQKENAPDAAPAPATDLGQHTNVSVMVIQ